MGTKKGLRRPPVLLSSHEENLLWEGKDLEIRGIITNFVRTSIFPPVWSGWGWGERVWTIIVLLRWRDFHSIVWRVIFFMSVQMGMLCRGCSKMIQISLAG